MSDQPPQIPPDMPCNVRLTGQQWFNVQQMLGEIPYKISAPYINEIQRQCLAQAAGQRPDYAAELITHRVNGGAATAEGETARNG